MCLHVPLRFRSTNAPLYYMIEIDNIIKKSIIEYGKTNNISKVRTLIITIIIIDGRSCLRVQISA